MTESNQQNQKDNNLISAPVYFSNLLPSNKNLLIGKIQLPFQKNMYKVSKLIQTSGVKEYIIEKEKEDKYKYKGNENNQDSTYVLMKYNSKENKICMYPANRWVNFFKSTISKKDPIDLKEREKRLKQEAKRKNDLYKNFFNTNAQFGTEDKKKPKRSRNNDILANNKEEEEELFEEKPKKIIQEFKEDSHSSEDSLALADDSFESDTEQKKKENEIKKKEKEKEKVKEKVKEEEEGEDDDDNDDSEDDDKNENSDDEELFMKQLDSYSHLIGKKKERENTLETDMEEKIENLLRKKNKMTEGEIIVELKKEYKADAINKYYEQILERITEKFEENGEEYYFLKK